jgi:hypothetical protein
MYRYAAIDNTTKLVSSIFTTDTPFNESIVLNNTVYKNVSEDVRDNETLLSTYFFENNLLTLPERPNRFFLWDSSSYSWVLSSEEINRYKGILLLEINKVRGRLSLKPIAYDNKTLDADTQAQSNINGKLQEIFAREATNNPLTSSEMFWKDADNAIHSWNNQNDYKLWLQGLVIAISSRNTSLYATAWTKKAEVEALTDINDILNYDTNTGW